MLLSDINIQSERVKTMIISLNPHFEGLVKGKVESTLYNSVSPAHMSLKKIIMTAQII